MPNMLCLTLHLLYYLVLEYFDQKHLEKLELRPDQNHRELNLDSSSSEAT